MGWLFNELLYRPLFNSMVFFYNTIPGANIGLAVILTTLVVRILMIPLYRASIKSQREMTIIQPIVKELQTKYKDDRQKLSEEMLKAYKEHNVNPFAGILLLFVQIPVLIAIYQVSLNIFKPETYPALYSFITLPENFDPNFFGLLNVADARNIILALIVGISQYYQIKLIMKRNQPAKPKETKKSKKKKSKQPEEPDFATTLNKQMLFLMPILVTGFAYSLPVTMSLYWITTTVFTIGQEFFLIKQVDKAEGIK
jgi:YidC/Oxa1 family membrane protein insertase